MTNILDSDLTGRKDRERTQKAQKKFHKSRTSLCVFCELLRLSASGISSAHDDDGDGGARSGLMNVLKTTQQNLVTALHMNQEKHKCLSEMIDAGRVPLAAQIKVIGVGGGGGNAVEHMIGRACRAWSSSAPTPTAGVQRSAAHKVIQPWATSGLGAGSKPEKGREQPKWRWMPFRLPRSKGPTCCSSRPAWRGHRHRARR